MPRPDGKPASDLIARHSAFVAALERSQAEGNFEHVEATLGGGHLLRLLWRRGRTPKPEGAQL